MALCLVLVKPDPPKITVTFSDMGEYTLTIIVKNATAGLRFNIRIIVHDEVIMKRKVDMTSPYIVMVSSKHVT